MNDFFSSLHSIFIHRYSFGNVSGECAFNSISFFLFLLLFSSLFLSTKSLSSQYVREYRTSGIDKCAYIEYARIKWMDICVFSR